MKRILSLILSSLAMAHAVGAEPVKLDPNGAYILKIERPFVKAPASWLPLRVTVQFKDGQGTTGGAFSTQFNNCWHPVDAAKLRLADSKISGELVVDFHYDSWEKYCHYLNGLTPKKAHKPHRPERVAVAILVDCPVVAEPFAGAAPGSASCPGRSRACRGEIGYQPPWQRSRWSC